jgi:hypothetical protein
MSFFTSFCDFPQKEQHKVWLDFSTFFPAIKALDCRI